MSDSLKTKNSLEMLDNRMMRTFVKNESTIKTQGLKNISNMLVVNYLNELY